MKADRALFVHWLVAAISMVLAWTGLAQTGSYDWNTASPLGSYPGIKRAWVSTSSPRTLRMHCLRVDITTPGIRFYATPQSGTLETRTQTTRQFITQSQSSDKKLVAAINANTWSSYVSSDWNAPKDAVVTGLAFSEGALVSPGHGTPSFLVNKERAAWIAPNSFAGGEDPDDLQTAVEGAWHLHVLQEGSTIAGDTGLHPRTGIGVSQDGRYVYFLAVDGRQPGSDGVSTQELGSFLKWFGAWNGINMDGGGSTTMAWWNPGTSASELLNNPRGSGSYSSSNSERYVAVNLGVYYAPDGYDAWVAGFAWGSHSSAQTSDPDADGLPNLAEYALGGNPLGAGFFPADVSATQMVFSDNFTGSSSSSLSGQATTTGGGIWDGASDDAIKADGSFAGTGQKWLNWTPSNGYVYELKVTINQTSGNWAGLLFKPAAGSPIWAGFGGSGVGTMLDVDESWPNVGGLGSNGSGTYMIRLDTTGAKWTTSYFFNGIQKGSTHTWTTPPAINGVGFISYNNTGTSAGSFSNFSLTAFQASAPTSPAPVFSTAASASALRQTTTVMSLPGGNNATHGIVSAAWGGAPLQAGNLAQTASVSQLAGSMAFGSQIKNINDGLMVSNGGTLQDTTHSAVFSSGSQVKFALSGTYDIARVDSFTSYQNTRTGQKYSVYTSSDNGASWTLLTSVNHANAGGNDVWDSRRVSIRNAAAGAAIARGVNALRFDFSDPSGGNGTAVCSEIAIYPASVAPDALAFSFPRARPDVTYTVQASDTLGSWTDVAVNTGKSGATVIYADSVDVSSQPSRFLRLKMSR